MRVLFFNQARVIGGAEQSLLLLIEGLRKAGIVTLVALYEEGPFRQTLTTHGVTSFVIPTPAIVRRASRYSLRAAMMPAQLLCALPSVLRLARLACQQDADLIHTNGMKAHLLGGLAARLIRRPAVWHVRDFPPPGWAGRLFCAQARILPALVLTNSAAVAAAMHITSGRARRVATAHNPVDLSRFHPGLPRNRLRQELGLRENEPLIGLIAHLTPWKGHELFLQIASAILDVVPDAHFVIVGGAVYGTDGHTGYAERLSQTARQLGLIHRLTFLGSRDDVAEILADLELLVHCPIAPEPFGRVVAEAMAVGRPVVAADSGGLREVVDNGITGLLVPPRDVRAFAEAATRLLNDPPLRQRFGRAGRRRAEEMFSLEGHVRQVLAAYQPLMNGDRLTVQ